MIKFVRLVRRLATLCAFASFWQLVGSIGIYSPAKPAQQQPAQEQPLAQPPRALLTHKDHDHDHDPTK